MCGTPRGAGSVGGQLALFDHLGPLLVFLFHEVGQALAGGGLGRQTVRIQRLFHAFVVQYLHDFGVPAVQDGGRSLGWGLVTRTGWSAEERVVDEQLRQNAFREHAANLQ